MVSLNLMLANVSCSVTFVYVVTTLLCRRGRWKVSINASLAVPSLVVYDFNAILGAHEKNGVGFLASL